jgi:hypothetical protein
MPKQKKAQKSSNSTVFLYSAIVALAVLCVVLLVAYVNKNKNVSQTSSPSISLGAMQYDLSSGKAVKRNDPSVKTLQAFLEADAAKEGCSSQSPAYEHVVAYTKDEAQVFIKYGCGAADLPIFAVQTNGVWKMLSPTNHFDAFGIPDCTYLADNIISKEIAPVCVNGIAAGTPTYTVR